MYDIKDLVDDLIFPNMDRRLLLTRLEPEDLGHAFRVACPACNARTALISKEGRYIRCREAGGCGHIVGFWTYTQGTLGLSDEETLSHLAKIADQVITHPGPYDFTRLYAAQKKARLLEEFLTWAEGCLENSPEAMAYLTEKRGFPAEQIREVKLGFYPSREEAESYLLRRGFSLDAIMDAGVLSPGLGDSHQLVAGYRDRVGRLTGIACRVLHDPPEGTPKYLYSHGTDKSSPYNLHKARDFMEVIIVEGVFDVLALRVHGIDTVIGVEDARLTREQVALLGRCGLRKVMLGFDRDEHGHNATRDALDILLTQPGMRSYVITLPEGVIHPDELIEDEGVEAYYERIKGAEKGVVWRAQQLLSRYDLTTDMGREEALREGTRYEETLRDPDDGRIYREVLAEALDVPLDQMLVTLRTERDVQLRNHLERGYQELLQQAGTLLEEGRFTELREHLQGGLYALRSREMVRRVRYFDSAEFLARAKETPVAKVQLGSPALTRTVNARKGDVVVVGARGRHGKSTFAYNLMIHLMTHSADAPVLYFGFENPESIAMARMATIWAHQHRGVRYSYRSDVIPKYQDGTFATELLEAFNALGRFGLERRFSFVYQPGATIDQVISYAQKAADERGGLGGVLVDYLELVRTATLRNDELRIAEVMSKLRQLAEDLRCPVFVFTLLDRYAGDTAPVNPNDQDAIARALELRRPTLDSFANGRRLQMEATTVMAIYNREREIDTILSRDDEQQDSSPLDVYVVANREGTGGAVPMTFDMKSGLIYDGSDPNQ